MYITEMKSGTEYNWRESGGGCFSAQVPPQQNGERRSLPTLWVGTHLVMYNQGLERTREATVHKWSWLRWWKTRWERSGFCLLTVAEGRRFCLPVKPLELTESRRKGATAEAWWWVHTDSLFLKTGDLNAALRQWMSVWLSKSRVSASWTDLHAYMLHISIYVACYILAYKYITAAAPGAKKKKSFFINHFHWMKKKTSFDSFAS